MRPDPIKPGIVRPAEDLAECGRQARVEMTSEEAAVRESVEHARRAGEWLKKAWRVVAPQQRWNKWLEEQGISQQRASERIRIYDSWSRVPPEFGSNGVAGVLNWLAANPEPSDPEEDEDD